MSEDISVLGIAVETRGVKEGSDALDRLTSAGGRAEKSANTLGTESRKTSSEIAALAKAALAAASAFGVWTSIKGIASSMIDAQQAAQKLRNSLSYAADGAAGASKEIQYLREVTTRLGMDFATSSAAYAKFAAATKDSGVSLSQTKTVFEGIAAASAKLGLSADETQGALLALSQMASKGTVSAEELRGQLGERLPGAFNIAAKSMGVTTAELGKMLQAGEVMASDFLPRFGQALKDQFQAPLNSLTQELNRFSSAWTIWKTELSDGANGGGFKWLTNGLNESSAAMHALGAEAGITQKLLMAIGGFQAGAVGTGRYDTAQVQVEKIAELKKVKAEILAMQTAEENGEIRLSKTTRNRLDVLKEEEKTIRQSLLDLAVRRGKETGLNMPDIAGEFAAQEKKKAEVLKAYLSDTDNAPKAAKVAAAVEKENAAFKLAVAAYSETDQQYQLALKAHNERVAELQKQPKGANTTKNDASQEYAARLSEEKDFTKTQIDLIKARVEQRVISEEDGIKQVLESQTAGFAAQQATLNAQLAATSDKGDKLRIGSQLQAIANDAQTAQAAYTTAMSKMAQARTQYMQSQVEGYDNAATKVDQENSALRDQIDILGMTDQQLGEYEAAKVRVAAAAEYLAASNLREAAASLQASDATNDAIPYYLQLADAREAAGKALDQKSLLESEKGMKKAAIEADKEWKKTADKIGDSITDALMRGFESGKGFAETLRDTVVNMFNTMVLQPVIKATVVGGLSALGMGSATAGDDIGGVANLISTGNSLFNIGSTISSGAGALPMTTTIAEGVGALGGDSIGTLMSLNPHWGVSTGTAIGEAAGAAAATSAAASYAAAAGTVGATASMASAYSVGAAGTAATGAGMGATAGLAAVPVAGWIALAAAAAYSIFGGKDAGPKYEGNYFGVLDNAGGSKSQQYATWWSHGTGYSGDSADGQLAQMAPSLTTAINGLVTSLGGTAAGIGVNYGFNHDDSGGANDQISTVVSDSKGNIAYENSYSMDSGGYKDALALEMQRMTLGAVKAADGIEPIFKELVEGIDLTVASAETITKAISDLQGIVALRAAFENLNLDADDLSLALISASGGVSALSTKLESYYSAYFTEAEKTQNLADSLTKSFAAMGMEMPASKAAFRAVAEGLDLTTNAGRATFAAMMDLAPSFATVADAAEAAAKAAKAAYDSTASAMLSSTVATASDAYSALESAVSAQKSAIQTAYDAQDKINQASIDASEKVKDNLSSLADTLKSAVGTITADSNAGLLSRRNAAQAVLDDAYSASQRGQSLAPFADSIKSAISDLSSPSDQIYSTFEEYARAQGQANAALSGLKLATDDQLNVADLTLKAIKDAADEAEVQNTRALAALDQQLANAKTQIDALNGINTSVLSVSAAMSALSSAISVAGAVKTALPASASKATTSDIVNDYQNILGRAPDASGLVYWQQQANAGASAESIANAFTNSPEGKVASLYSDLLGRAPDAAGSAFWQGQIASGASVAEITAAIKYSEEYRNSHAAGLERVPYDGYKATLHAGEAVVDAQSTRAISRYFGGGGGNSNNEALILEVKALREELNLLRYETRATATNTGKMVKINDKWDNDGMPAERIAA